MVVEKDDKWGSNTCLNMILISSRCQFMWMLHELETQDRRKPQTVVCYSFLLHCLSGNPFHRIIGSHSLFPSCFSLHCFLFHFLLILLGFNYRLFLGSSNILIQDEIHVFEYPFVFSLRHFGGIPNWCCLGIDLPVRNFEEGPFLKSTMEPLSESPMGRNDSPGSLDSPKSSKHVIDTAVPFDSVKDAVSKFGGSLSKFGGTVEWKSRRTQSMERSRLIGEDFGKAETAEELENTKKLVEVLKLNLERAEKDENEAKEEVERVILKIEDLEQEIMSEASIEAKAQLEVERAMYTTAVSELESVKRELELVRKEYVSIKNERDIAINTAGEAVAASEQMEKEVEDLEVELIATKEELNSTRTAHLEVEEQRSGVINEESHSMNVELEQAEKELQILNEQVLSTRVLKSKLDASSNLLVDLKAELATYMESKLKDEQQEELEEIKVNIEKATAEVNRLKEASIALKSKLEEEKLVLTTLKHSEEKASAAILTLQDELEKSKSAAIFLQMKENEAREAMTELPKKLQEAAQEADEAKSLALAAQKELLEAQEEVEQAKARSIALKSSLLAAQKEIEATKASEMLARDAITTLEKSESDKGNNDNKDSSSLVTLTLDEYHELSKRAYEAEEQANATIEAASSQIKIARESELRSLEKLEELNEELSVRKESLNIATENADKAEEGKLAVAQELTACREMEEQQKKAGEFNDDHTTAPLPDSLSSKGKIPSNNTADTGSPSATKTKKKKKKSSFPSKVVMFFAKRKTHPTK
ncbi:hypothetical protein VNO77_02955 [Canavalia gladiata]|uniref:Uncharacterized protein n=1 Tax=Canavalia gladiata TaxID=3824 RepID=A0AAN9MZ40_CANGL